MLQAFIIVLREGFEAFLLVSIIVSYLRKINQQWLLPAAYWGIGVALLASTTLGFVFNEGANQPLWEGVLGLVAVVMVTTLVVQMWRYGRFMRVEVETKLGQAVSRRSRRLEWAGVFGFTVLMMTREGMETALLLIQVRNGSFITGLLLGLAATAAVSYLWARFSPLINVKLFFQVTGIFLLLFMAQILIYSFHEFTEAGLIPNSDVWHAATEPFSPDGLYGKWFSLLAVSVCAGWLLLAGVKQLLQKIGQGLAVME